MAHHNYEVLSFIEDYRKHRLLWDTTDKFYNSQIKRIEALKELGEKHCMDVAGVKKKIKSLRSYFSREMQRVMNKQGIDGTPGYRSSWFAYESLSFIADTINLNETKDSEDFSRIESTDVSRTETVEISDEDAAEMNANVINNQEWVQPEVVFEFKPASTKKQNHFPQKKRKLDMSDNDLLLQKALRTFNEEEDQYDIFGKYVASEMRNLPSDYLRKKMKRKIQQVVLQINEEDELLSNNASQSCSNPNSE